MYGARPRVSEPASVDVACCCSAGGSRICCLYRRSPYRSQNVVVPLIAVRRQAVNNCTQALKIEAESSKALYRRAYALFAKKDNDGAKADLLQAQRTAPGDKAVATLLKKVRRASKVLWAVGT